MVVPPPAEVMKPVTSIPTSLKKPLSLATAKGAPNMVSPKKVTVRLRAVAGKASASATNASTDFNPTFTLPPLLVMGFDDRTGISILASKASAGCYTGKRRLGRIFVAPFAPHETLSPGHEIDNIRL